MPDIQFTQYLRPNGQKRRTLIDRPQEIADLAKQLTAQGYVFEIEELSNGVVSMTVEGEDGPVAIHLVPNGPRVPAMVDQLVKDAAKVVLHVGR